jgi:hypothetical protein
MTLLDDKDKMIIVGYVYIKDMNKTIGIRLLHSIKEYLQTSWDDTVKVLVMPVLTEEKQGIELLNPKYANNEMLEEIKNSYEKLLKQFAKNNENS